MVVSLNRGHPNLDPDNTIGTPKMVPLILGNPAMRERSASYHSDQRQKGRRQS